MRRTRLAILSVVFVLASSQIATAQVLPEPKAALTSQGAGVDEVGQLGPKENKKCNFLCDIFIVNLTQNKVKVSVRASLLGFPGYYVDVPSECHGKVLTSHPCEHPWHLWFDQIRIGVWDGEMSDLKVVDFKNDCCKRRFTVEYVGGKLRILER